MHQPALAYHPPNAVFVVGYPIEQTPITRNEYGRERDSVRAWLDAIEVAAARAAAGCEWPPDDRYAAVIEVRIPWDADIDNFLKDTLDQSARGGLFGGDDKRVDLLHGTKRVGVPPAEAGAHVDVWRLATDT